MPTKVCLNCATPNRLPEPLPTRRRPVCAVCKSPLLNDDQSSLATLRPSALTKVSLSPLALPFTEALQPSRFLAQVGLAAEAQARRELSQLANAALKPALLAAKFALDAGGLRVVFDGGVPKGAKLMESLDGRVLPNLVDGRSGKIVKLGRVASKTRTVVSKAFSSALILVEAAHVISGYDNAQRLKRVERGINVLVHAHHSELRARLEAIYRYSKELLAGGSSELSEEDRRELHRQCRDLIELRARWRDDFRYRLGEVRTAEPGWFSRFFFGLGREKSLQKSRQEKATEASECLESIQLMHFSLLLQMSLAGAAGRLTPFQTLTLPEECQAWRELGDYAAQRGKEICGGQTTAEEFRPFLGAVDGLVEFWSVGNTTSHGEKLAASEVPAKKRIPAKRAGAVKGARSTGKLVRQKTPKNSP